MGDERCMDYGGFGAWGNSDESVQMQVQGLVDVCVHINGITWGIGRMRKGKRIGFDP